MNMQSPRFAHRVLLAVTLSLLAVACVPSSKELEDDPDQDQGSVSLIFTDIEDKDSLELPNGFNSENGSVQETDGGLTLSAFTYSEDRSDRVISPDVSFHVFFPVPPKEGDRVTLIQLSPATITDYTDAPRVSFEAEHQEMLGCLSEPSCFQSQGGQIRVIGVAPYELEFTDIRMQNMPDFSTSMTSFTGKSSFILNGKGIWHEFVK